MKISTQLKHFHFFILVSICMISCNGQPNSTVIDIDSNYSKQINELVSLYNFNEGFNGSILVAKEGEVILEKGYGEANKEWNIANTADTKFRIASVTKPFTAVLV